MTYSDNTPTIVRRLVTDDFKNIVYSSLKIEGTGSGSWGHQFCDENTSTAAMSQRESL
ncbi:MAG: hypothetical protein ABGZ23_28300 [Fuerstiella sp.]